MLICWRPVLYTRPPSLHLTHPKSKAILDRGIDEAWGPVKDEVKFVYASSDSGRALFAAPVADICQEEVATKLREALDAMSKQTQVTQKEFIQKLHEVKVATEGIAGVSALKGRREVVFKYRGINVPLTVSSIQKDETGPKITSIP
eukprot:1411460-Amphidinium_carterae.1